jgi:parallel beta-helix repeat protein
MRRFLGLTVMGALAATLLALNAGEAFATHVACGDTITQDTTLDGDLIDCPGDGIVIGADGITLDLNGHTIDGDDQPGLDGDSGVDSAAHDGLSVLGGVVRGFEIGVNISTSTDTFRFSSGILIQGVTATGNSFAGINVDTAQHFEVTGNLVVDNGGDGIRLQQVDDFEVTRNFVSANTNGITMSHANVFLLDATSTVARNRIVDNSGPGLFIGESVRVQVVRNVATGNETGIGLVDSRAVTFEKNTSSDNLLDGIHLGGETSENLLIANRTDRNGDDGIDAAFDSEDNVLIRNVARYNGDFGIAVTPSSEGKKNKARGNGNPLQCLNLECK